MSNVVDLASRRKPVEPDCGCDRHVLLAVVERMRARLDQDGALVLPRCYLEDAADDLLRVIDRLLPTDRQENHR